MQLERSSRTWIRNWNCLVVAMILVGISLTFAGCSRSPEAGEQQIVRALTDTAYENLNRNKQAIFSRIHPVGQATWAEVNEAAVSRWRNGEPTGRPKDVAAFDYVFTIHWDSPLVRNGYTRIFSRFDFTAGRTVEMRILETNGLTNQDASNLVDLLGGLLLSE